MGIKRCRKNMKYCTKNTVGKDTHDTLIKLGLLLSIDYITTQVYGTIQLEVHAFPVQYY